MNIKYSTLPAFLGLLFLSLCSCNHNEAPGKNRLPPFETTDIKGNKITDANFREGFALLYFPEENLETGFFGWVDEYENENGVTVSKLVVNKEKQVYPDGWIAVVDKALNATFRKRTGGRNIAFFKNGTLVFVHNIVGNRSKSFFLLNYHSALNDYLNPREYIEESRPEDFIRVDMLFKRFSRFLSKKEKLVVLVVTDPWSRCGDSYLFKYFGSKAHGNSEYSGVIVFDDCISRDEINTLKHNAEISIPMDVLDDEEISGLEKLRQKHFGARFNILLSFDRDGEFTEGIFVYDRCPGLASYL